MYKYIALTALVLGSAALGFNINRGDGEQFSLASVSAPWDMPDLEYYDLYVDIDQDGYTDRVGILHSGADEPTSFGLKMWRGIGNGEYESASIHMFDVSDWISESCELIGPPGYSLRACEINGDSYPDLVCWMRIKCYGALNRDGDQITGHLVHLVNNNEGGFTCAGDVTEDGTTDVKDLLGVIADWGCIEEGQPD